MSDLTPERLADIRARRKAGKPVLPSDGNILIAALDAAEKERDEALTRLHGARWAMGLEHHKGEAPLPARDRHQEDEDDDVAILHDPWYEDDGA